VKCQAGTWLLSIRRMGKGRKELVEDSGDGSIRRGLLGPIFKLAGRNDGFFCLTSHTPSFSLLKATLLFFFSLSFLASPRQIEFLGQGSDSSHSCKLCHSCGNARSLTNCARTGVRICVPVLQRHHRSCCTTVGTPIKRTSPDVGPLSGICSASQGDHML